MTAFHKCVEEQDDDFVFDFEGKQYTKSDLNTISIMDFITKYS